MVSCLETTLLNNQYLHKLQIQLAYNLVMTVKRVHSWPAKVIGKYVLNNVTDNSLIIP